MQAERQEARDGQLRLDGWQVLSFASAEQMPAVLNLVASAMAAAGYPEEDRFAAQLALDEAIRNALKHGNGGDRAKRVRVRYHVDARRVLAEVEDEGRGFDPAQVPDPRAVENLGRPGGRGVLLMRRYTTWLRFNERGNCVSLGWRRSGS
jgi:serine/threonine-protein kinase RsbW